MPYKLQNDSVREVRENKAWHKEIKSSNHLLSLKKPFEVLLSLMVTVRKFVVTSVTKTFSTLPMEGLHANSSKSTSSLVGDGLSKK